MSDNFHIKSEKQRQTQPFWTEGLSKGQHCPGEARSYKLPLCSLTLNGWEIPVLAEFVFGGTFLDHETTEWSKAEIHCLILNLSKKTLFFFNLSCYAPVT